MSLYRAEPEGWSRLDHRRKHRHRPRAVAGAGNAKAIRSRRPRATKKIWLRLSDGGGVPSGASWPSLAT